MKAWAPLALWLRRTAPRCPSPRPTSANHWRNKLKAWTWNSSILTSLWLRSPQDYTTVSLPSHYRLRWGRPWWPLTCFPGQIFAGWNLGHFRLCHSLSCSLIFCTFLWWKLGVTSKEITNLAAETCAYMAIVHPDYTKLANRVTVQALHDRTETCILAVD